MHTETPVAEVAPPPILEMWRRPPGWYFHLALVPPALGILWAHSHPGLAFFLWMASGAALAVGAMVWFVRGFTFWRARRKGRGAGQLRWFAVAPAAGLLVLALVLADGPLRARWALSRPSFEKVVEEALEDDDYASNARRRLGTYEITFVYRQQEAVIFYDATGALFDDAGFAYLPNGPFPELEHGGFERPQFRHLGGPWYAWTASW